MSGDGRLAGPVGDGVREGRLSVAILLSGRLAEPRVGLDLAALEGWLGMALPAVTVHVVPDLARQPGDIGRLAAAGGATRLVLGLESAAYPLSEIQVQARKAGLDPLGVEIVNLGLHRGAVRAQPAAPVPPRQGPRSAATERAKLLLAAAVAKARAFPGSRPEHLKASLSLAVSRRALFTLAVHEYRAVPAVRPERCAAERGCRLCVEACPPGALRMKDRRVELDKERCASCALCVSACPADAVEFPGHTLDELEAQIAALLDPAGADLAPRGVLFLCQRSAARLDGAILSTQHSALSTQHSALGAQPGWLPVVVPCVGGLSAAVWLRSLTLGAAAVGVAGCGEECALGQGGNVAERIAFCQDLLGAMGAPPERVRFCPLASDEPAVWDLPDAPGGTPAVPVAGLPLPRGRAAADALLLLARAYAAPESLRLDHPQSPYGLVQLDASGCTGCGACAGACPAGALASVPDDDFVTISFDAAACTGCGLCAPRCPEVERGVLRTRRGVDLQLLAAGRVNLYHDRTVRCQRCGAPIASGAMVARVAAALGDQYGALAPTIGRYCSDCRGLSSAVRWGPGNSPAGDGAGDRV